ncbi:MAG TPA: hypothetical protein VFF90_03990 [Saprospiraceae bacterium]|nr:hypothetical protein [Saprospiraceae bacterium]
MKNKSFADQKVLTYKTKPYFLLNISYDKKWKYFPNSLASDSTLVSVSVLPGQAITDTVWITESTRLWNHRLPGKISFDKGGSFYINAFLPSPMGWGFGSKDAAMIYINE